MLRNLYRDIDVPTYVPQVQRTIIQPNQLEQGVWLELIPNKLKMIIIDPGAGPTPKTGEFIRLKQFIYLADMTILKQERITYTFNRNKIILGLQYCLALCRQGFKARIFIPSELAYGKEIYPRIPANSDIVVDVEVSSITTEPVSIGKQEDQQLISQIIAKAKDGDEHLKRGQFISAQKCFETAYISIQSTRSKQIKNHLYYNSRITSMISSSEKTPAQIKKEKEELVKIFQIFDRIKVKTVQVLLINKDYYKVIMFTRQCLMESRLEQNCRILAARSRAFVEIGECQKGIELMQHLSDQYPNQKNYQQELKRAQSKANNQELEQQSNQLLTEPILTLTNPNNNKGKTKQRKKEKVKELKYEQNVQEQYEADGEIQKPQEPFFSDIGLKFFYQGRNDQ